MSGRVATEASRYIMIRLPIVVSLYGALVIRSASIGAEGGLPQKYRSRNHGHHDSVGFCTFEGEAFQDRFDVSGLRG